MAGVGPSGSLSVEGLLAVRRAVSAHERRYRAHNKRAGNDVLGVGPQPFIVGNDLNDVADQFIARHSECLA